MLLFVHAPKERKIPRYLLRFNHKLFMTWTWAQTLSNNSESANTQVKVKHYEDEVSILGLIFECASHAGVPLEDRHRTRHPAYQHQG